MLKKFTLKNYKNFKDEITIDFENIAGYQFNTDCLSDGIIGKMLIYGRNATGKTNLGRAILDIGSTMFGGTRYASNGILLNADSKEDAAMFQYEFRFEDTELSYKYSRLSNQELREEELSVNGKSIFKCNFGLREYNFDNLDYIDAETANIDRYLQSLEPDIPYSHRQMQIHSLRSSSPSLQAAPGLSQITAAIPGVPCHQSEVSPRYFYYYKKCLLHSPFPCRLNPLPALCKADEMAGP